MHGVARHYPHDGCEVAPGRVVIVFWQRGRHVGPLETPLGEISPTGREVEVRVIDVLSITDGRISA